jgi:nucleotide-binding universal stress UspA family protein
MRTHHHNIKAESALFRDPSNRVADMVVSEPRKWRADLIVMGTHGRRGINRLMPGSDAEQVIRTSPVPVLTVRGVKRPAR